MSTYQIDAFAPPGAERTIAVWFSCGAASAVAALKTLEEYSGQYNVRVINNPVAGYYSDTGRPVSDDPNRACGHCNLPNRDDECDPCLGKLPGVANACCGHGSGGDSYIQFDSGLTVRGF